MAVLLVAATWVLSAAAPVTAAEPRASLPDIEDEVMCPICGTLLELSESPQADRERELIRRLIDQGKDKQEIKDALVAQYGKDVLATPDSGGFDLTAWVVPAAGIAAAILGVALVLRRRRLRPQRADEEPQPSEADLDRLDRDLSSYEL